MITRLGLKDFKNFADAELKLGKFTVILGTNASGKSNIRDAFRFLHGVGREYTLSEIFGGKWGVGGQKEWDGIRGAMSEIVRKKKEKFCIFVDGYSPAAPDNWGDIYRFSIGCALFNLTKKFEVTNEELVFHKKSENDSCNTVYKSNEVKDTYINRKNDITSNVSVLYNELYETKEMSIDTPIISQLVRSFRICEETSVMCHSVMGDFERVRFFDYMPSSIRLASPPGQTTLGDHGENLPTVLQAICDDPARKETLMEWVRALTPMDVTDFKFRTDLNGFVQLYLVESDETEISAVSASDGTLRFLALLAALLGPNPAKLYFFEEIESGIHPARLHLLIDMLERQTAKSGIQVVTTTHSPELLSLLSDETLKSTSIVYRPPGRSDAIIKPVLDFPNIQELREQPGLGRLHSTGWFERALSMLDGKQAAE